VHLAKNPRFQSESAFEIVLAVIEFCVFSVRDSVKFRLTDYLGSEAKTAFAFRRMSRDVSMLLGSERLHWV